VEGRSVQLEFLKINPNGKIPTIVDHDGRAASRIRLFESARILLYLAEKTGSFCRATAARRYDVIQWLMIQLTGVGPMFGQLTHSRCSRPQVIIPTLWPLPVGGEAPLRGVGQRLATSAYLGGAEYSIATWRRFRGRQSRPAWRELDGASPSGALVHEISRARR